MRRAARGGATRRRTAAWCGCPRAEPRVRTTRGCGAARPLRSDEHWPRGSGAPCHVSAARVSPSRAHIGHGVGVGGHGRADCGGAAAVHAGRSRAHPAARERRRRRRAVQYVACFESLRVSRRALAMTRLRLAPRSPAFCPPSSDDSGRKNDVFRGHNLREGTYSPRVFGGQARRAPPARGPAAAGSDVALDACVPSSLGKRWWPPAAQCRTRWRCTACTPISCCPVTWLCRSSTLWSARATASPSPPATSPRSSTGSPCLR